MAIGMLGLFLEFSTPGFGIPGIALLHFPLLRRSFCRPPRRGGRVGSAGVWSPVTRIEIFVIPGFGVAGIGGLIAVLAALVMMMVALPLDVSWEIGSLDDAISRVSLALAATIGLAFVAVQTTEVQDRGRLVLQKEMTGADGFESLRQIPEKRCWGRPGESKWTCGPPGKHGLGRPGRRGFGGGYVEKGSVVSVVRVEGARVVVRSSANEEGLG